MTYGPATTLNQLRPGAIFEAVGGKRYVLSCYPNYGGWLSVMMLSNGKSFDMPQGFVVREIVLPAVITSPAKPEAEPLRS